MDFKDIKVRRGVFVDAQAPLLGRSVMEKVKDNLDWLFANFFNDSRETQEGLILFVKEVTVILNEAGFMVRHKTGETKLTTWAEFLNSKDRTCSLNELASQGYKAVYNELFR